MALCNALDIETAWAQLPGVQIVPLLSWYEKPEESTDSLYVPQKGEDAALHMWADNRLIRWPRGRATHCPLYAGPKYRACSGRGASHYL